jgi:hypothetical protein
MLAQILVFCYNFTSDHEKVACFLTSQVTAQRWSPQFEDQGCDNVVPGQDVVKCPFNTFMFLFALVLLLCYEASEAWNNFGLNMVVMAAHQFKNIYIIQPMLLKYWTSYQQYSPHLVGFEVLTAVFMNASSVFWGITWCSLVKANNYFRGILVDFH